jgi:hypothetical protein
MWTHNVTFEANGKGWKTDKFTLDLMREFREAGNARMVSVVFEMGLACGRIKGDVSRGGEQIRY